MSHPLPEPVIELIAARFRVLGDPARIRLLELLHEGDATVQELIERTGTTRQTASKHLRVLLGAGIVSRRRAGAEHVYSIADPTVFTLCETVCGGLSRRLAELDELLGSGAERTPG